MVSRRSVLVGLGGIVAGGGALIGTGAFTTVEAERTVNVETTGDASAFLGLAPANRADDRDDSSFSNSTATGGDANEYVSDPGDGTIQINLDGNDEGASGLNQNARTRFERLVVVTNNGTQDVTSLAFNVTVSGTTDNDPIENAIKIVNGSEVTLNPTSDSSEDLLDAVGSTYDTVNSTLEPGESVFFGIEVDLLDSDVDSIPSDASVTMTITAATGS